MKPTERFSSRVDSYRQHRPGYPGEIVDLLTREGGLRAESVVADVAAGTGLLSEIFLKSGYRVTAVEPNAAMREACEQLAAEYPKLTCIAGTAEATGLADGSADLITVGQAMHWFDLKLARAEFSASRDPAADRDKKMLETHRQLIADLKQVILNYSVEHNLDGVLDTGSIMPTRANREPSRRQNM